MRNVWLAAALIAMTFAAYAHTFQCGWIWDDDSYVHENKTLTEPGGLHRIWFDHGATRQYYPLVFTTFWLEARLWGLDHPAGFHAVNVLLHALVAVLFWVTLRRLGFHFMVAWCAAAVFALHPVHVESVAWVTERKNTLSAFFYLLAALSWMRFCPLDVDKPAGRRRWSALALAIIFFQCALLSKTVTATLPAAIALGIWWKRGAISRIGKRDGLALVPLFVLGLIAGLITVTMEKTSVGATGAEFDFTLQQRILIAARAAWFYLGKLAWPADLVFIYPRWDINAHSWPQWMFFAAIAVLVGALAFLQEKIGRGPLAALLFFLGTLTPALGFFNVYPFRFSFVADHFQYLASLGPIALAAACAARLRLPRAIATTGITVLLIGLGVRTYAQTLHYENAETLWHHTLARNPKAWIAHNNLGTIHMKRGERELAERYFRTGISVAPRVPELYLNMGQLFIDAERYDDAIAWYKMAVDLDPTYIAHMTLATLLDRQGRTAEAVPHYVAAIDDNRDLIDAYFRLAGALMELGRVREGHAAFVDAHLTAARLLRRAGETEAAQQHEREAERHRALMQR